MEVEWLLVADSAQVVGNKLYVLGGGWDTVFINRPFPVSHRLAVAVAFKVPWEQTNQPHPFEIEIQDDDANQMFSGEGQLEVGRPPGALPGSQQRAQAAVEIGMEVKEPGNFVVIARADGEEGGRFTFRMVAGPRHSSSIGRLGRRPLACPEVLDRRQWWNENWMSSGLGI